MALTERDKQRLQGVHPDLRHLVDLLAWNCPVPFMVLEGVRSVETQAQYVASGASQTMDSRHLYGLAVDLAPMLADGSIPGFGDVPEDWPFWEAFAVHMKGGAALCGTPIIWGGDWETLVDGPHWELSKTYYPNPEPGVIEEPVVA